MSYEPPNGYKVGLTFVNGYVVPAGYKVGLEFSPSDGPVGDTQYLFPSAFDSSAVGSHEARQLQLFVNPVGWQSGRVADPRIWNLNQVVKHGGSDYLAMNSKHSIWLWDRYVKLDSRGINSQAFGTAWASHYLRYVTAAGAGDLLKTGKPWLVEDPRYLRPVSIAPIAITDKHTVGGSRWIYPQGTEMTEWGTRIIPEGKTVYGIGFDSLAAGQADLRNHLSYVAPQGFKSHPDESLRFGVHHLFNLRQIVQQDYDPNDGLNPQPFGQWTAIENRNKEPHAFGWQSHRFGYQFIWNKAVQVIPSGIKPPENDPFYKAGSVSHKNRPIEAGDIDSLVMSGWTAVTNIADLLHPSGFDSLVTERSYHTIENRSRQYSDVGNFDSMSMGTPFVAPAVRGIDFESRYSIEPPQIELPTVELYTRYVQEVSAGEGRYGLGIPSLSIHWQILQPKWAFNAPDFIGQPALRNLTPELYTGGANHEEFGEPFVRTQWREILPVGDQMQSIGRATVRDRTHKPLMTGIPAPVMSPGPVVTRIGGLPDIQRVLPPTIHSSSWLAQQVGKPMVGAQEIYPVGRNMLAFGSETTVVANSIRIEGGIWPLPFGDDHLVTLKNRELDLAKNGIEPVTAVGAPSISPHTIYAVVEAPQQAKINHPSGSLHYVDHDPTTGRLLKGVGTPSVTNYHRFVKGIGIAAIDGTTQGVTKHKIFNQKNWIELKGIKPPPMGIPVIPGKRIVKQLDSKLFTEFGKATVAPPPYTGPQTIKPSGVLSLVIPTTSIIEYRDRERAIDGWDSMGMGKSKPGDTPYMWQGLRVGPLVPVVAGDIDSAAYGEPWISFKVRQVSVEGYDAFRMEYDLHNFNARMRVWRREDYPSSQLITAGKIAPSGVGVPAIGNRVHYILPDGNSDQHRKGVFNA